MCLNFYGYDDLLIEKNPKKKKRNWKLYALCAYICTWIKTHASNRNRISIRLRRQQFLSKKWKKKKEISNVFSFSLKMFNFLSSTCSPQRNCKCEIWYGKFWLDRQRFDFTSISCAISCQSNGMIYDVLNGFYFAKPSRRNLVVQVLKKLLSTNISIFS